MTDAAKAIAEWRETNDWKYAGPPPGAKGCLIPIHELWLNDIEPHADDLKANS
jgi:hypothetical protein